MSNAAQQTVTAANILSGDKSFRSVQFAVTGDLEIDLIAGFLAVIQSDISQRHPMGVVRNEPEMIVRVLRYLTDRYQSRVESDRKQREMMERMQTPPIGWPSSGIGSAGTVAPPLMPYTTSGAGLGAMAYDPTAKENIDFEKIKTNMMRGILSLGPDDPIPNL